MIRRLIAETFGRVLGVLFGSLYALWLFTLNVIFRDPRWLNNSGVTARWFCNAKGLRRGIAAITFGSTVYSRTATPWDEMITHEHTHVLQYGKLGWVRFLARYGWEIVMYGYRDAPLEKEARDRSVFRH